MPRLRGEPNALFLTSWAWVQLPADGIYATNDPARAEELLNQGFVDADEAGAEPEDDMTTSLSGPEENVTTSLPEPVDDVVTLVPEPEENVTTSLPEPPAKPEPPAAITAPRPNRGGRPRKPRS